MDSKISEALDVQCHDKKHRSSRPFLTPHQIAIRFHDLFPHEFSILGKPIGGQGAEKPDSLTQYISQGLSKRITQQLITNIEECFLHTDNIHSLHYAKDGQILESSTQSHDLSMYRLRNIG
ncbi:MAG TPA: hypothetical protein VK448_00295 [Dissulfurispiraceae bacterium]|nr:hypothetical protein [Dissulfurispiraceae bacterium]